MKQLIRIEDDLKNSIFHRFSDGEIYVGIHPVMFGYRIRSGYNNDNLSFNLDYCGGANYDQISEIYSMVLHILKNQKETDYSVFPSYERRPIHNDEECIKELRRMSEGCETHYLAHLHVYKELQLSSLNVK